MKKEEVCETVTRESDGSFYGHMNQDLIWKFFGHINLSRIPII